MRKTVRKDRDIKLVTTIESRNYLVSKPRNHTALVMHEFWYDYIKPKYREKARLCFTDTDSLLFYIKRKTTHSKRY